MCNFCTPRKYSELCMKHSTTFYCAGNQTEGLVCTEKHSASRSLPFIIVFLQTFSAAALLICKDDSPLLWGNVLCYYGLNNVTSPQIC